ncbi:tripartite tricarboxylate transporter TctB family protein [Jannaschia seohaensis]|uniref:Tripartite tricarboxylate transporter TctB family protein n=1 Tax=Jannaschia seohaensis TaxID=475081 RepID=A0A2Y9AMZ1_9RHOB|nr:tripartite tricarboxylate transporter TctB family protein [Jannaschia seohaensis]PWJ20602.1 tripartite tricarboxylate transporter TctB family protein [Jannaschia seohaensis]SSA44698.1 Tripartite tricarboxylate transporter TctB family protein [Jannaschia seohaensis]
MPAHVRLELWLIAILLPAVALFAFWFVPLSIDAPQGFGADSEISPRFAPYLLASLMAAAMIGRLLQIGIAMMRGTVDDLADDLIGELGTAEETRRGGVLNFVSNLYAFVLIPVLGFYIASICLVTYLVRRLGESRIWVCAVIAVAAAAFTYLLFEQLLSVRLPDGLLGDALEG